MDSSKCPLFEHFGPLCGITIINSIEASVMVQERICSQGRVATPGTCHCKLETQDEPKTPKPNARWQLSDLELLNRLKA